jgi:actin-like ATPase involved in cell morphogenesis
MSRLGGISYGRVTDGIEIPRPEYDGVIADEKVMKLVE